MKKSIIEASQREELSNPDEYLWFCAKVLVRLKSNWPGLPKPLERLLSVDASVRSERRRGK